MLRAVLADRSPTVSVTRSSASPLPLTVMELFEVSVVRGPFPDAFAHLLRGAEALVRALPPDYCVEPDLGPICQLEHYGALAWCVSHFGDVHYREATSCHEALGGAAALPRVTSANPTPQQRPTRRLRPVDEFTRELGLHLTGLMADGRAGHYRVHGWLGAESVDHEPGWFVDGNLTFDALGNALRFADGRETTGIEGRWLGPLRPSLRTDLGRPEGPETDSDSETGDDDDSGEMAGPPVSAAVHWFRRKDAKQLLKDQLLKKRVTVDEGRVVLKISRADAERAFDVAVPPDRRRRQGGQKRS